MLTFFHRFLSQQRGSVAIIVAVLLIFLLFAAGCAVDFIRYLQARTALQAAVDSAVLAAGNNDKLPIADAKAIMQSYLDANIKGIDVEIISAEKNVEDNKGTDLTSSADDKRIVSLKVEARLKTLLLRAAGIDKVPVTVGATAGAGVGTPLDLVLVLDNTSSMTEVVSGKRKIDTLKEAATDLVNKIMINKTSDDVVRVGIVPYMQYIRLREVGGTGYASYSTAPWLTIPPPATLSCGCRWSVPQTCVTVPGFRDGIPQPVQQCTGGVMTCNSVTRSWTGCLGVRPQTYHASIGFDNPKTALSNYSGILTCNPSDCGEPMTDMTADKSVVLGRIQDIKFQPSAFMATAETYIPGGLNWGWNMIDSAEPLTNARTNAFMTQNKGQKVIVLMTDGVNSFAPLNATSHLTRPIAQSTLGAGYPDSLTATLCSNIKTAGITIYTVAFNVPAGSTIKTVLENCAGPKTTSGQVMYFDANSRAALLDAFDAIARSLKTVKLDQ